MNSDNRELEALMKLNRDDRESEALMKSDFDCPDFDFLGNFTPSEDMLVVRDLVTEACSESSQRLDVPARCLEIGSWVGQSAIVIADTMEDESDDGRLYCIDSWDWGRLQMADETTTDMKHDHLGGSKVFNTFVDNIGRRMFDSIFPLRGSSDMWLGNWPEDELLDFVWIDGDHTYEQVLVDLAWSHYVRDGGTVACHDYGPGYEGGVVRAVNEVLGQPNVSHRTCWVTVHR